jgi:hypothetical protein
MLDPTLSVVTERSEDIKSGRLPFAMLAVDALPRSGCFRHP